MDSQNIREIRELIKMKKERPEEYKKLLEDMADVMFDVMTVTKGVVDKLQEGD